MLFFFLTFGTGCSYIDSEKHNNIIAEIESPTTDTQSEEDTQDPLDTANTSPDTGTDTADSAEESIVIDSDGDGLSDEEEQFLGTDPLLMDTDGDNLSDGEEVNIHGTDPLHTDSDLDRLSDGDEISTYLTNPNLKDSDAGGVPDGVEILIDNSDPSHADDDSIRNEKGLFGGHLDVDTTASISSVDSGFTDEHVHKFDDDYDVTVINAFDLYDSDLHTIQQDIGNDQRKFKVILANPDLNIGARISINQQYDPTDRNSWISAQEYADIPLTQLPVYALSDVADTVQLESLTISFDEYAILFEEVHGTKTACVRNNRLGPNGEWRNGSLVLQAVMVNEDGSDAFQNNTNHSAGGLHGVVNSGLLWEMTVFWHWSNDCFE